MNKKIFVFDNVIIGNNHLVINASIINIAKNFFEHGNSEILCFGDKSHMLSISRLLRQSENCKVSFNSIEVIHPKANKIEKFFSWLNKLRIDKNHFNELIELSRVEQPKLFVINTLIPLNLFRFIGIMNNEINQKFLIFLHGELEYIFKKDLSFGQKIKGFLIKKALKKASSNTKFIVFSDYIKESLINKFNFKNDQIISVNHPILEYVRTNHEMSNCISFSHIGVANIRKNSSLIFKLADDMVPDIENYKCKFSIIGKVDKKEINHISNNVIVESKDNNSINNEKYIELITKSDYSLIFLFGDEYVHRISGSLLDSIQYQVPIIALKHPTTIELFDKGGDIGFLCDNFEEMQEVINEIVLRNHKYIERYKTQILNLKELSKKFYSDNAAFLIKQAVNNWK